MAKERQKHSIQDALGAIIKGARAEVDVNLDPAERAKVINECLDVVQGSGMITMAGLMDDGLNRMHDADDRAAIDETRRAAIDAAREQYETAIAVADANADAALNPAPADDETEGDETAESAEPM
jgi:hypothetical protein